MCPTLETFRKYFKCFLLLLTEDVYIKPNKSCLHSIKCWFYYSWWLLTNIICQNTAWWCKEDNDLAGSSLDCHYFKLPAYSQKSIIRYNCTCKNYLNPWVWVYFLALVKFCVFGSVLQIFIKRRFSLKSHGLCNKYLMSEEDWCENPAEEKAGLQEKGQKHKYLEEEQHVVNAWS